MRRGFAPTSRDLAHLAAANGLEPTTRWTCDVESMDVRSDICAMTEIGIRRCRAGLLVGVNVENSIAMRREKSVELSKAKYVIEEKKEIVMNILNSYLNPSVVHPLPSALVDFHGDVFVGNKATLINAATNNFLCPGVLSLQ